MIIALRCSRPIIRAKGVNCRNINMHAYKRPEPVKPQDNQRGLEIIFRSRAELKPDPANPRRHSKKQIKQIAKSISVFGFNVPILVDRDSNVIAGHSAIYRSSRRRCSHRERCAQKLLGFHNRYRREPPKPSRNVTLAVPGGSNLTAPLTGSPKGALERAPQGVSLRSK